MLLVRFSSAVFFPGPFPRVACVLSDVEIQGTVNPELDFDETEETRLKAANEACAAAAVESRANVVRE